MKETRTAIPDKDGYCACVDKNKPENFTLGLCDACGGGNPRIKYLPPVEKRHLLFHPKKPADET